MLRIEHISARPASQAPLVIQDLSLEARPNEILVVLGASGCGKSTLLRTIAGLVPLEAGRILHGDRDITKLPPSKRGLSLVFQSDNYYDHWTLEEHLRQDCKANHSEASKVDWILHQAGLADLSKSYPHQLSGGQRQRLALARAMVAGRSVILLDEPLVHLDEISKQQLMPLLMSMKSPEQIVIYVTHDYTDAMLIADRIAILANGAIVQAASPNELYRNPVSRTVSRFLGQHPMQYFHGELDRNMLRVSIGNTGVQCCLPHLDLGDQPICKIVLGVRPEHIKLTKSISTVDDCEGLRFQATVQSIRTLGALDLISLSVPGSALPIHVLQTNDSRSTLSMSDSLECLIGIPDMILFDASTELLIRNPSAT